MTFQIGHKTNIGKKNHLGFKHSTETKLLISQKGKGRNAWNKGKTWSDEICKRISETNKRKGIEPKVKFVSFRENHPNWIKDRTKLCRVSKQGERRTSIYFDWRKMVWTRDNWSCRIADINCDGRMEAHHILGWTKHPELRYDINNGITLCRFHHPKKREDEDRLSPYFRELVQASLLKIKSMV